MQAKKLHQKSATAVLQFSIIVIFFFNLNFHTHFKLKIVLNNWFSIDAIDTIVKRDCYESLSRTERAACESGETKCDRCSTTECNLGHPKHKCKTCDSKSDSKCLNDAPSVKMDQCLYDSNGLDDFYCYVKWVWITLHFLPFFPSRFFFRTWWFFINWNTISIKKNIKIISMNILNC